MMKRDEGEDDFVTKTAKHRKKHAANGGAQQQQADDPAKASSSNANDGKPPTGAPAQSSASAGAAAAAPAAGDGGGISLRPRTMFAMKGRGRTESEGSAYRPQWSKDGEGFVTAASNNGSAGAAKDSASAAHHDPQGVADASRRKGKVLRYSKEELLALHFTTTSPPDFPPETMVASDLALPPVSTLPFDYEEIYEQWKLNRNRGRGRGRGTATTGQTGTDGQQQQQQSSDRSRSNGKWEDEKWDKSAKRDNENQQQGEEGTWQRGLKPSSSSRQRDDIWDDVGGDGIGGDSNEMDLSSMAVAAERFRREMDAMRDELNAPVAVDLKEHNGDLDEFDKKLEVAAAAGQFDDSDEEDIQWDEPTDIGGLGSGNAGPSGDHSSSFFNQSSSSVESQFGILDTKQFSLGNEEKSFSLQQLGGEPLQTLEPLRMVMEVRDEWFYLDPQGIQQGPFKSAEMREWFEAGYFKPHLPIRFGQEGQFTPLASQFLHGQVPFAIPPPQPSPKIAAENEHQRLFALQQEQQRQEQLQQQQMLQLQQQQEHQRMLQLNQEEKIRMEMQRLEIARQQQSHLYQQQLQHQQQQQLQQQQQQHQQQQQQQHMLLQQQSSWQRTQREGIMSALGIFGGSDQDRNATDSFHTGMQPQFQSDFRTQHHHQFGSHDPAMRDSLFLNDGGARQQNEFWQSSVNAPVLGGEPLFNQAQPSSSSSSNSSPADALLQSQAVQEKADAPLDPWGKPKTSELSSSFSSLHEIQNEEKRKAADEVRNALSNSPDKPATAAAAAAVPAAASPPRPAAPAAKQSAVIQKQTAAKAETSSSSNAKKTAAAAAAPKPKGKTADNSNTGKSGGAWVDPSAAPTKSLQEIQQEEQRELRKKMEETSSVSNLEQMGAQLKMMLGVASLAGPSASASSAPQPPASASSASQPPASASASASSAPQPPASASASSAPQPPAPSSSNSGASPWGVPAAAAQLTQASKKQSLRDILAEEERLAQERAKQSQGAAPASSHWVNVVAGTSLGAAPAPKPSRSLGPVPVSVLKSRQQIRAPNGSEAVGAAGAVKTASPTPPKADDASFWNFGAAQAAKSSTSTSSANERPADVKVSNAFGSTGVSSEFMSWAAKQFQLISGRNDLTLMEYCASLEDPGEIREYLAAYLGSTPRVSAFATEFIQRKKKGPSAILKRSPSAGSSGAKSQQQQDDAADAASGGAKKGSKRRGGKGQKIDPSLLNFA